MLSETCLTDEIFDSEIAITGYNLLRCDSNSSHTGGLALYTKSEISIQVICNSQKDLSWFLAVKVISGFAQGVSPQERNQNFIDKFDDWCSEYFNSENELNVICGDFNIDVNKNSDTNTKNLLESANMNNLYQIVNNFTRETHLSQTIIDLVFTKSNNTKCVVSSDINISDHNMLKVLVKACEKNESKLNLKSGSKLCWKNYSKEALNKELIKIDWNYSLTNVEEKFEFLFSNLNFCTKKLVSVKNLAIQNDKKLNKYLCNLKRDVSHLKYLYKNDKSEINWQNYKVQRNFYKNEVRTINNNNVQNEIEKNIKNSKKLWKTLKSFYSSNNDCIKCVEFEDGIEFNEKIMANKLNEYFVNSVKKICSEIPTDNNDMNNIANIEENENKFDFKTVEISEIKKVLKNFVNKNYIDLINGKVLNDSMENEMFAVKLCEFINESLMSAFIPDCWKTSTIVPLKKVANTTKADELRLINMLPIPEKLLEVIVKDQGFITI